MSVTTKEIDIEQLRALDLQRGDTLHVISEDGKKGLVRIERSRREDGAAERESAVREWLRTSRGSVVAASDDEVDQIRLAYYAEKYGLKL